jgi:D-alanyl-D-alanine carboxypeptidase
MRRLAARRAGGLSDRGPSPRRPSVAMLAAGLVAVLLLVVATVVWWPRDRAAAPASSVSPSRASRPLTDPAALQKQLDRVLEAGAPGVVGLVRAGERTWQGASGLGDLRANRPARASDRFRIGSVTKSFVATLVLQLVGEGRLRLDDNLERWLPGLVPGGERVTVRQLLNHTSGLYDYSDDLSGPPRRFRPRGLVAIATGHKPLFAPGTEFSYSNPTTSWPVCWWSGSPAGGWPTNWSSASSSLWAWTTPSCQPPSGQLPARMSGAMRHPTRIGR